MGENHWETTHMKLDLTGKILMVHSVTFEPPRTAPTTSPSANLTYKDAIRILESESDTEEAVTFFREPRPPRQRSRQVSAEVRTCS